MKTRSIRLSVLPVLLALAACTAPSSGSSVGPRPMDEVPTRTQLAGGERQYAFTNGCVIVLEPKRAVVKREGAVCELHHRDIALLYASGD